MTLSAPEWAVQTGGLRALNCNHDASDSGIFTDQVGVLTIDFFIHLTNIDLVWEKASEDGMCFALKDRATGITKFTASRSSRHHATTWSSGRIHSCVPSSMSMPARMVMHASCRTSSRCGTTC